MRSLVRHPARLAALLGLLAVGASGCAEKIPSGPVGGFLVSYPEGRRDSLEKTPSDLIVWPDVPLNVFETSTDTLTYPTRTFQTYRQAPGVMHGMIVDYSQAGGYQMYRQEDGSGYRLFTDYLLTASRRWSDRGYYGGAAGALVMPPGQFFTFSDRAPVPTPLKSYVGRAVIAGQSGGDYPLTNRGATPDTIAIRSMRYTGLIGIPGNPNNPTPPPPDSLIALSWESIPGAAAYWVHIYQKRADIRTSEEAIAIAQPAPIASGKVRDLFIGYFPAPITAYKLGDPVPPRSRVLVYRVLLGLSEVLIRVSAVDAQGRLIACISTDGDRDEVQERFGQVDRRRTFLMSAKKVTPDRPQPPLSSR